MSTLRVVEIRRWDATGALCLRDDLLADGGKSKFCREFTRMHTDKNFVLLDARAIETDEEHDHIIAVIGQLMDKGEENLSPEESALLETMAILVQAYDDRHHALPAFAPHQMLAYLLESSGRTAKDLLPALGTRGRVSEVLNGKRSISKEQAKKLAALFKVTADLFI